MDYDDFANQQCVSIARSAVFFGMSYARLFMTARKRRHLRAQDPHNAISRLAPSAQAPDDLWLKIESRLDETAQPQTARNQHVLLGAVGGMALAMSFFALTHTGEPAPDRLLHAELTHDGQAYRLIAARAPDGQSYMSLASNDFAPPQGKSLEVWFVPEDGSPPGSLGLASGGGALSTHVIDGENWENGVLAVSVEDSGGSQSGAPEGPVIATAPLRLFF